MAFKIIIPLTSLQPEQTFKDDLVNASPKMISSYGSYFRAAAAAFHLPVAILYTIAMIEQTGEHYNKSGTVAVSGAERSTGIMQISPDSFYETLKYDIKNDRMGSFMQGMMAKYLPNFRYSIGQSLPPTASAATLNEIFAALKLPEFNIWAGAEVLRRLIETTANSNGSMRLDKAIVKYNIGEYSKPTKTMVYNIGDTTSLAKSLNSITKSYIVKAVGKNGAMDYYLTNKIS